MLRFLAALAVAMGISVAGTACLAGPQPDPPARGGAARDAGAELDVDGSPDDHGDSGSPEPSPDAGPPAGPIDSGTMESMDAGGVVDFDAGAAGDAGPSDASASDASASDASASDAGASDAGADDAGAYDSGT